MYIITYIYIYAINITCNNAFCNTAFLNLCCKMLLGNMQQFKFYQWPSEILPLDPILSHLNPVTPLHHYFRSILIMYLRLYLGM